MANIQSFPLNRLFPELRSMIWYEALLAEQRLVVIVMYITQGIPGAVPGYISLTRGLASPLLFTSRESRDRALRFYNARMVVQQVPVWNQNLWGPAMQIPRYRGIMHFNLQHDTFLFTVPFDGGTQPQDVLYAAPNPGGLTIEGIKQHAQKKILAMEYKAHNYVKLDLSQCIDAMHYQEMRSRVFRPHQQQFGLFIPHKLSHGFFLAVHNDGWLGLLSYVDLFFEVCGFAQLNVLLSPEELEKVKENEAKRRGACILTSGRQYKVIQLEEFIATAGFYVDNTTPRFFCVSPNGGNISV
ncbi:hypothetical protein F5Y16DRAFT_422434 [Xylariaceae sp. FL0255]|nr:hypothetical protein F5Y16DRAFT_422434 [Xylariaceae sp. FL0255]